MLPHLYVAPSSRGGRGVFTSVALAAGEVIERAHVIVLSAADRQRIHTTKLHDYYFQWDGEGAAIALGYGSLYNHSDAANAEFECDYEFKQLRFFAIKDIAAGDEITTNYRVGDKGATLWFEQ